MNMSEQEPITKPEREPHHATMTPYVVGFVLSLVFTLIPYYLIVQKTFSARMLLIWIVGFAFLQMAVQLIFFLHLGREKKPHFNLFFLISTGGIILMVVVGSIWIMSHLMHGMSAMDVTNKVAISEAVHQVGGTQTGTCPGGTGTNHSIMLMDNKATPSHVDAKLCDTLTFMNHDTTTRDIMFGADPVHHSTYAGDTGESVRPGRSEVITLTELGTHQFHDRMLNTLSGDFSVSD